MTSETRVGRVLGALLLLHFGCGLILPYVLLGTAMAPPGSVVEHAAALAATLRAVVLLFMLSAGLVLAIAITAWPVFQHHHERLAIAFLGLAVANLPLQLVESGTVLTILSLGERLGAHAGDTAVLEVVGGAAVAARRWAHYMQLLTVVSWLFVLYAMLWRTALVPRLLAVLGMATTLLQIAAVPTRGILGLVPMTTLAMPLAPVHVALALWLIVRGLTAPVALGTSRA